jgi:hypothetical protein
LNQSTIAVEFGVDGRLQRRQADEGVDPVVGRRGGVVVIVGRHPLDISVGERVDARPVRASGGAWFEVATFWRDRRAFPRDSRRAEIA